MDNKSTARRFCKKRADDNYTNSNKTMIIGGRYLHSYGAHYLAAVNHGDGVILVNSEKSSPTTESHKSLVRRYAPTFFNVPYPAMDTKKESRDNYLYLLSVAEKLQESVKRARENKYFKLEQTKSAIEKAADYKSRFL